MEQGHHLAFGPFHFDGTQVACGGGGRASPCDPSPWRCCAIWWSIPAAW
jgi:hypothetical protein